jgi:hypothetical protein
VSPRSIRLASSTSCGAVSSAWRPASRRKSCSELGVDRVRLERVELERLENLEQVGLAHLAGRFRSLQEHGELLTAEDRVDLDRHASP